jgi:hypothetical protein
MTDENRATIRKALKAFDDENFHNGNDCTLSSTALAILDAAPSPEPIQVHFEGTHPYGIDPENPEPSPGAESAEELIQLIWGAFLEEVPFHNLQAFIRNKYIGVDAFMRKDIEKTLKGPRILSIVSSALLASRPAPTAEKALKVAAQYFIGNFTGYKPKAGETLEREAMINNGLRLARTLLAHEAPRSEI